MDSADISVLAFLQVPPFCLLSLLLFLFFIQLIWSGIHLSHHTMLPLLSCHLRVWLFKANTLVQSSVWALFTLIIEGYILDRKTK